MSRTIPHALIYWQRNSPNYFAAAYWPVGHRPQEGAIRSNRQSIHRRHSHDQGCYDSPADQRIIYALPHWTGGPVFSGCIVVQTSRTTSPAIAGSGIKPEILSIFFSILFHEYAAYEASKADIQRRAITQKLTLESVQISFYMRFGSVYMLRIKKRYQFRPMLADR
jgi:hypothetical protein